MIKSHWSIGLSTIALVFPLVLIGCGGDDDDEDAASPGGSEDAAVVSDGEAGAPDGGKGGTGGKGGKGGSGGSVGGAGGKTAAGGTGGSKGGAGGSAGSVGGTETVGGTGGSTGGTTGGAGGVGGAGGTGGSTTTTPSCPTGNACSLAGDVKGFCRNDACRACTGKADNAACSTAYGEGQGYICVAGNCVVGDCIITDDCAEGKICGVATANKCGNCSADTDCTGSADYGSGYICVEGACIQGECKADSGCSGKICGLTTPYKCESCTSDTQCKNASYGATYICNTKDGDADKGKCVSSTCSNANQKCTANEADFCCDSTCVPGNCCETAHCSSLGNDYVCQNHTCTQCAQATNNTYYVDPVDGSDTVGTGNNSAGCRFKTITRALAFIGASPAAGTKVLLVKGPASTSSGETFPVAVPRNVTISGSGGRVQIVVPSGSPGFTMANKESALENLDIDGSNHTATNGVYVNSGSEISTTIMQVAIHGFASDGIRVVGTGNLAIGAGVSSTNNGSSTGTTASGLYVGGTGAANTAGTVMVVAMPDTTPIHFDDNTAYGIRVGGAGIVKLNGIAGTIGNGTVTANRNGSGGVLIWQTPGENVQNNAITGLAAWANGGAGLNVYAGSSLTLRESYFLNNSGNGVTVSANFGAGAAVVYTTSTIDLGTHGETPDWGGNTLQASSDGNPNTGAGICLSFRANTTVVTLNAAGNIFAGAIDCSTSTATLKRNTDCSASADVSARANVDTSIVNIIDVTKCQ